MQWAWGQRVRYHGRKRFTRSLYDEEELKKQNHKCDLNLEEYAEEDEKITSPGPDEDGRKRKLKCGRSY